MEKKLIISEINKMRKMMNLPVLKETNIVKNKKLIMEGFLQKLAKEALESALKVSTNIDINLANWSDDVMRLAFGGKFVGKSSAKLSDLLAASDDVLTKAELKILSEASDVLADDIANAILKDKEVNQRVFNYMTLPAGPTKDAYRSSIEAAFGDEGDVVFTNLKKQLQGEADEFLRQQKVSDDLAASLKQQAAADGEILANETLESITKEGAEILAKAAKLNNILDDPSVLPIIQDILKRLIANKKLFKTASPKIAADAETMMAKLKANNPKAYEKWIYSFNNNPIIVEMEKYAMGRIAKNLFITAILALPVLGTLQFGCYILSLPDWGELGLCEKYKPFGGTAWQGKKEEKSNTTTTTTTTTTPTAGFTIDDVVKYAGEQARNKIIDKDGKLYLKFTDGSMFPIVKTSTGYAVEGQDKSGGVKQIDIKTLPTE